MMSPKNVYSSLAQPILKDKNHQHYDNKKATYIEMAFEETLDAQAGLTFCLLI